MLPIHSPQQSHALLLKPMPLQRPSQLLLLQLHLRSSLSLLLLHMHMRWPQSVRSLKSPKTTTTPKINLRKRTFCQSPSHSGGNSPQMLHEKWSLLELSTADLHLKKNLSSMYVHNITKQRLFSLKSCNIATGDLGRLQTYRPRFSVEKIVSAWPDDIIATVHTNSSQVLDFIQADYSPTREV